ncbi:serine/threonine protein kinase [Sanguibacter gelidistatuariae]|uniref:non-specific serine/threonine protein kinase n=1 Tax=Sanguibacter gelidistatuariae TaxID=1814289 RepID=A0A1G6H2F8_9MICO|nr:Stk1 family PASTA domain-containing Ser/Thr kinase [Sanguibacter gelidistatuariae]SDB88477.1 serine/threonine protein kinase [Sanguibacter gelidistatuariae]
MVDETPRILAGRYEVGELIGRGGMAEVHIGHDNRLGRTVAIKILRSDLARDPSFQARFRREAQSAAALNHPAIVAVYDTGEDTFTEPSGATSHVPFIVMEYVEGHTVRDILRDGNAVPIEEAVEITSGVLSALEYSHHAGIVHRDIKPANVMLTPTGAIKVMDFGIARALADSAATMTQTQAVIGTAQYLSPEQARGESVDARSDLYSTGCLLFELLTGRPPFTGDSPVSVAYQHVREAPVSPSSIASDIPETLDRVTLKALAKERTARYGSAAEFRADLEAAIRGGVLAAASLSTVTAAAAAPLDQENPTEVFSAATGGPATQVAPAWAPLGAAAAQSPLATIDGDDEDDKPRHRALLWTLITIAVVAVAAIATMLLLGNGDKKDDIRSLTVPTLTGMTVDQAKAELVKDGFDEKLIKVSNEKSTEVESGLFIRSEPDEGSSINSDKTIELWFSIGADAVAIPDVARLSQEQAIRTLTGLGFVMDPTGVTSEFSTDVPADAVTRTEPKAGEVKPPGTVIKLFTSNGFVDLPDLTGLTSEDAQKALGDLNLSVNVLEEPSEAAPGTIVSQDPGAGRVAQRSRVTIHVAVPIVAQTVPIPTNLVNMTEADAQSALAASGLVGVIRTGERANTSPKGVVEDTSPQGSVQVDIGSTVLLFVSDGSNDPANKPTTDPTTPETSKSDKGNNP